MVNNKYYVELRNDIKIKEILGTSKVELKSTQTQTICKIQNEAGVVGSKICILINVEKYNTQKKLCDVPVTKNIAENISVNNMLENMHITKQADKVVCGITTQTSVTNVKSVKIETGKFVKDYKSTGYKSEKFDRKDFAFTSKQIGTDDKNESVNNMSRKISRPYVERDVEFVSISITVRKTYKIIGQLNTEQNPVNLNSNKCYEDQTLCSNIAISGTLADKIQVIRRIINNSIIDMYEKLMQIMEDDNLKKGEDLLRHSVTKKGNFVTIGDSTADTKERRTAVKNLINVNASLGHNIVVPTVTQEKSTSDGNSIMNAVKDEKIAERVLTSGRICSKASENLMALIYKILFQLYNKYNSKHNYDMLINSDFRLAKQPKTTPSMQAVNICRASTFKIEHIFVLAIFQNQKMSNLVKKT